MRENLPYMNSLRRSSPSLVSTLGPSWVKGANHSMLNKKQASFSLEYVNRVIMQIGALQRCHVRRVKGLSTGKTLGCCAVPTLQIENYPNAKVRLEKFDECTNLSLYPGTCALHTVSWRKHCSSRISISVWTADIFTSSLKSSVHVLKVKLCNDWQMWF